MQQRNNVLKFQKRAPRKGVSNKFWLLLLFFAVSALAALYWTSPLALVDAVEIHGNDHLSPEEISAQAGLEPGMHIWKINLAVGRDKLLSNPRIEEACIKRKFPNAIDITLVERRGVAILQNSGSGWIVSGDGVVVAKNEGHSLPWLTGLEPDSGIVPGDHLEGQEIELALDWLETLDPLEAQISEFNFDGFPAYISLITTDGFKVLFAVQADPQGRVSDLSVILQELRSSGKKGTIDFRSGDGKAVFVPWHEGGSGQDN